MVPTIETYSIDESFLDLTDFREREVEPLARALCERVLRWTGIPTCVGIGSASTAKLSKLGIKTAADLAAMQPDDTRVLMTVSGGRVVYDSPGYLEGNLVLVHGVVVGGMISLLEACNVFAQVIEITACNECVRLLALFVGLGIMLDDFAPSIVCAGMDPGTEGIVHVDCD